MVEWLGQMVDPATPRLGATRSRRSLPFAGSLLLLAATALASAATVGLAYRTRPLVPLAVCAALAAAALAIARPLTALYVAVLLIPLDRLSLGFGGVNGVTPAEAMFVLTAAGW